MSAVGTGGAERLPRLLALVPWLLAHPGTPVGEVARVFDVPERQVRSDLSLLWMCGLPGHTPGDLIDVEYAGDRVTLSNADTIARPLRLTGEEALALVVALRALAEVPGLREADGGPSPLERVLAKLETAAGAAVEPASRVEVRVEAEQRHLPLVRRAVEERRRLHLVYHVAARDETTERDVDPMRLLLVEGRWYLEAWCRRVDGVRLFRLDRILDARLLDARADPPVEARPRDLEAGLYQPAPTDARVVLRLRPGARWVADYYPVESAEEAGDDLVVTVRTADTAWLRRLVLRLGGAAAVVEPASLRADVQQRAEAALAAYPEALPGDQSA